MQQKKLNTQPKPSQNDDIVLHDPNIEAPDEIDIILGENVPKKKKRTKEFYVDEKEFNDELLKYYNTNLLTEKLMDMIRKMLNGLAHRPNFINYTFRDEAVGDGLVNIMAALHKKKFKFEAGKKPFSYFNAIAWNCWRNRIKREARQRNAISAYQDEVYSECVVSPKNSNNE